MAKLSVDDQIFQYKDTRYQIGQIVSIREFHTDVATKRQPPSKTPAKILLYLGLALFLIGVTLVALMYFNLIEETPASFASAFGLFVVSFFALRSSFSKFSKISLFSNMLRMHKFEIELSNGRLQTFESSNGSAIATVKSAIHDAMQKRGGVSVSMQDVNIEVTNSTNTNFGSVS